MAKASRSIRASPSWLALALLVALLAAAMEHSPAAAAEEEGTPEAEAPAAADEETTTEGAPAPAPASDEAETTSIGAKAKAGLHTMMEGLSAGKAKVECKVMGNNCPAAAPAPEADA